MPSRIDAEDHGEQNGDGSGSILAKLHQPQFDPVDFLNDSLPSLNLSSQTQISKTSRSTQIQGASTDSLALLTSLNTISIRASSDLTSLTDEIIRSGNRLAYEVEVLRGDVNGFHELLTDSLRDDISQFVKNEFIANEPPSLNSEAEGDGSLQNAESQNEPDFMARLRLLGKVKARLESVIAIFGEAMKWPIPPSELSMASALISVSSPELGIQSTAEDDKAREVLKSIRAEIDDLLGQESAGYTGLEAASQRVEEYRQLAMLWKGTGEEKARVKFVDSLVKLVEERRKTLDARERARNPKVASSVRSSSAMDRNPRGSNEGSSGAAGLFRNLQRLKDDLYLE
ncbi:uncharacterized protein Z520_04475 [Fonsecaea multimorphosa CBS 102226]|uniref:Uncharacterized protein n=1 Tax=Fonsecaea multimorphosa CBS 102226 TaxID=1442371 RepID=A0A0D2K9J4_9EURO|nr:uncharacterized protein Z520_04475 [Fonsecaea multimorphosa CBS 102226]KIX99839.1 hypothetical protein Z520_04475 [Fonsecaea multimorphosa CBS 102226]OAL26318.1 hypothetical protein AYO22_04236 [Fonsecaea multimorphosa]